MHDEVVGKSNSVRLHGVADGIGVVTYVVIIEVCDLSRRRRIEGHRAQGADVGHGVNGKGVQSLSAEGVAVAVSRRWAYSVEMCKRGNRKKPLSCAKGKQCRISAPQRRRTRRVCGTAEVGCLSLQGKVSRQTRLWAGPHYREYNEEVRTNRNTRLGSAAVSQSSWLGRWVNTWSMLRDAGLRFANSLLGTRPRVTRKHRE